MKTKKEPAKKYPKGWSRLYRVDRRRYELICPHGIGHYEHGEVHGCDGCCGKPEFQKALAAR